MINLSLSTIATAMKGRLICHASLRDMEINNLVTDSRALIQKGNTQQEITKQKETTNAFFWPLKAQILMGIVLFNK